MKTGVRKESREVLDLLQSGVKSSFLCRERERERERERRERDVAPSHQHQLSPVSWQRQPARAGEAICSPCSQSCAPSMWGGGETTPSNATPTHFIIYNITPIPCDEALAMLLAITTSPARHLPGMSWCQVGISVAIKLLQRVKYDPLDVPAINR